MIRLDIPSKILEHFSVRFRGIKNIGSPVFRFFVGVNNPKNPDETVLPQVHNSPFGGNIDFRNIPVIRIIRVYQSIWFEPGTLMPLQRADQFQVIDTGIPWIEYDATRPERSFIRCPQHISEMIIFGLPVLVGMIDPKIYRNYRWTIRPDRRNQVDSLNYPMVFSTPVSCNQFNLMRIRFVQSTVIDYQHTFISPDQPFRFPIQRLRVGWLSL